MNAFMIVLNAELIPNDRFAQLLGRVGRHGEEIGFRVFCDKANFDKQIGEVSAKDVSRVLLGAESDGGLRAGSQDRTTLENIGKASNAEKLLLNSTYIQKKEISQSHTFSMQDSLRNTMCSVS